MSNPYAAMTEEEMLLKLKRARESARDGDYRRPEAVISDIKRKYGLEEQQPPKA